MIHELSLLLFCSVSPLYVYMGGFCCMRPLVGVTIVFSWFNSAGFFVSQTGWPCFFCRSCSLCSFAVAEGRGRGRADRLRLCCVLCRWYVGRGGRAAESTRAAGAWRCGSGRFPGFLLPLMELNGRGRRGASAPVPY